MKTVTEKEINKEAETETNNVIIETERETLNEKEKET